MNLKQLAISLFLILINLTIFFSCNKIETPYFKPVYTDRNVLMEFISDAQTLDANSYEDFVNLSSSNALTVPMIVLSGDISINGNTLASEKIVNLFKLNTDDSLSMINRSLSNSAYGIEKSEWDTQLKKELSKPGEFNLEINGGFDYISSQYTGVYSVSYLNGYDNALNVSIYLLEDSLFINSQNIMNVLKLSKERIFLASQIKRGETIDKYFTYDLSSFNDVSNLKLLFVLEAADTKEILQTQNIFIQGLEFNKTQKVLVEDFTGHKCGNCPKAHEELALLQSTYGSKIVPMAIHFGYYAETDGTYTTDFRTPTGDAIGNKFGVTSTPTGLINRVGEEDNKLIDYSAWDAAISNLITNTPKIGIAIAAQVSANKIDAKVFIKAFDQNDTLLKIQVFVLENHIVDKQLFYDHDPEEIDDYEHKHVLRGSLNGNWGEDLTTIPFKKDVIITKQYSYSINSKWNSNNLILVAIVYNDITKEICQVEEIHLQ